MDKIWPLKDSAYSEHSATPLALAGMARDRSRLVPELERQQLVVDNAGFKKQIADVENKILRMLSESGGDILGTSSSTRSAPPSSRRPKSSAS